MSAQILRLCVAIAGLAALLPCRGQIFQWDRETMIRYTAKNPYDRFPDGRPKVPNSVLEELREMSSEEFLGVGERGSMHFVDGFRLLNPEKRLIGRAFTMQVMPLRAEIADADAELWKQKGHDRPLNHQTAIDQLQPGDVLVVDAGGGPEAGGIVGNNLSYYIWKKTGTGYVIDGAIRDLENIVPTGMPGYFRHAAPPPIRGVVVTGINVPVRIGKVTVMPGDVVFGDREGVTFVPPHQVQGFIDRAKITAIKDEWTQKKFDEGKYKSSDIYGYPRTPELIQEYEDYLRSRLSKEAWEAYKKQQSQQAAPAKPR